MTTDRMVRRLALLAGGAAVAAMATLTAGCGGSAKEEPTTTPATTSPSTSASTSPSSEPAPLTPTEKAVAPGGENSFSPTVNPVPPGAVCKEIVGGVCVR